MSYRRHQPSPHLLLERVLRHSQDVASRLENLGYSHVRTYRDGIQGWLEAGLPTESGAAGA